MRNGAGRTPSSVRTPARPRRALRALCGLPCLLFALPALAAGGPVHELPPLPKAPSCLFASSESVLYAQVKHVDEKGEEREKLFSLDLGDPKPWQELEMDGLVEVEANAFGQVFALCREGAALAWYRLSREKAERVAKLPAVEMPRAWYVDMAGRVWVILEHRLAILQPGLVPEVIESPPSRFSIRRPPRPCEHAPGRVVLYFNTTMVWAEPNRIREVKPPPFAADGTAAGPIPFGHQSLLSAAGNARGLFMTSSWDPEDPPKRLAGGLDWHELLGSEPDGGGAFVLARKDNRPGKVLVRAQETTGDCSEVKGGDLAVRWGLAGPLAFDSGRRGYAALKNGMLAVLTWNEVKVLTPRSGLPFPVSRIAMAPGDRLALVAADGRAATWDTKGALAEVPPEAFAKQEAWSVQGPCCVDSFGRIWAFLPDFPGRLARFDGATWETMPADFGGAEPVLFTADDRGALQVGFRDKADGSARVKDGAVQVFKGEPHRAWVESVREGATQFSDGTGFRTPVQADGKGKLWLEDGAVLWAGESATEYREKPAYRLWWLDPDGSCWRAGPSAAVYREGRWNQVDRRPEALLLGPRGLQSRSEGAAPDAGFVRVKWVRENPEAVLREAPERGKADKMALLASRRLWGKELCVPSPSGGGWVGDARFLEGVFFECEFRGRRFETPHGRYVLDSGKAELRRHAVRPLEITGELVFEKDDEIVIDLEVQATPPPAGAQLLLCDENAPRDLLRPGVIRLHRKAWGSSALRFFAVDAMGDVSPEPFWVRFSPVAPEPAAPPAPGTRPRWARAWTRVRVGTEVFQAADSFAADAAGDVFVTAKNASTGAPALLVFRPADGQWALVPGPAPAGVLSSPDGKVWGVPGKDGEGKRGGEFERPLFSVSREGVREAAKLYVEEGAGSGGRPRIAWDAEGRLWNLGRNWIGRWDGKEWLGWECPVGPEGVLLPGPTEGVVVASPAGIWDCSKGLPGRPVPLPDGCRARPPAWRIGERHLVVEWVRRGERREESGTGLLDLVSGAWTANRFSSRVSDFLGDGRGGLYAWEDGPRRLVHVRPDLVEEEVPYFRLPPREWGFQGRLCLFLPDGLLLLPGSTLDGRTEGIVLWSKEEGARTCSWREGIPSGKILGLIEDRKGRAWILCEDRLIAFDPSGDPSEDQTPFKDWVEIRTRSRAEAGFGNRIWYWAEDGRSLVSTDGVAQTVWQSPEAEPSSSSVVAVSDRGEALCTFGWSRYRLFLEGGSSEESKGGKEGILALQARGAKEFRGGHPAFFLEKEGLLFFEGEVWDGKEWKRAVEGRPYRGPDGALWVLANPSFREARQFRFAKGALDSLYGDDRFLLDGEGWRTFDAELARAEPGRYLVVIDEREYAGVAFLPGDGKRWPIEKAVRAFPDGEGGFLIEAADGFHSLSTKGWVPLDARRLPFGKRRPTLAPLAGGRWAFIEETRVLVAPPRFWKKE